jgi:hypothetical protein
MELVAMASVCAVNDIHILGKYVLPVMSRGSEILAKLFLNEFSVFGIQVGLSLYAGRLFG